MIISDLNYMEAASEVTSIVGGARRGNKAKVKQRARATSNIGIGGNVDDSTLTSVAVGLNLSDIDQDNQANNVEAFL